MGVECRALRRTVIYTASLYCTRAVELTVCTLPVQYTAYHGTPLVLETCSLLLRTARIASHYCIEQIRGKASPHRDIKTHHSSSVAGDQLVRYLAGFILLLSIGFMGNSCSNCFFGSSSSSYNAALDFDPRSPKPTRTPWSGRKPLLSQQQQAQSVTVSAYGTDSTFPQTRPIASSLPRNSAYGSA